MDYDVIGDIHGHAHKLTALLHRLGYVRRDGTYRHPTRTAAFVGDFIDRGPQSLETVTIVRAMVQTGSAIAVMGNHEFNAIAWHTPNVRVPGEYLRERFSERRGTRNRHQHAAFLAQVEHDPSLHADVVAWFLTLPLWFDLPELRLVHACWHGQYIDWLGPQLREGRYLSAELMAAACDEPGNVFDKDRPEPSLFKAVEALTKGIELPLPPAAQFADKDGIARDRVRSRWWDPTAHTLRELAHMGQGERDRLPEAAAPAHMLVGHQASKPVFFGHYWMTGEPSLMTPMAACVDYSAGKGGPLMAYRLDAGAPLSDAGFVWVA